MLIKSRVYVVEILQFLFIVPLLVVISFFSRFFRSLRGVGLNVGFGPVPINLNHAKSLRSIGVPSKSYCKEIYSIGGVPDVLFLSQNYVLNSLIKFFKVQYIYAIFTFSHLVFYFDCGPFGHGTTFLWRLEHSLLKLSGVRSILTAYGSDVHSFTRMQDVGLKSAYMADYPNHWKRDRDIRFKVDYWSRHADWIVAGCDWVRYLNRWDQLELSHFAYPVEPLGEKKHISYTPGDVLRVLHAPNHFNIKGTGAVTEAIERLNREGFRVELTLLNNVNNDEIIYSLESNHLVIDQLVVGWYAQFAIESMAHGVPVICKIDDDLVNMQMNNSPGKFINPPIIHADVASIYRTLLDVLTGNLDLDMYSQMGFEYVLQNHSFKSIGNLWLKALNSIK